MHCPLPIRPPPSMPEGQTDRRRRRDGCEHGPAHAAQRAQPEKHVVARSHDAGDIDERNYEEPADHERTPATT